MKILYENNRVILENVKDFEPKHIFECGQCFRWNKNEDDSYTGVAFGKVLNVKKEGNVVYFNNTQKNDFENIWYDYFDLGRDYSQIKDRLSKMDSYLKDATKFGYGIRILNQDVWETMVSFIISANNRIPMIKRAVKNLSQKYGDEIEIYEGEKYYAFPSISAFNEISIEEIRKCGVGFRDKYIKSANEMIIENNIDIYKLKDLDFENCKRELMNFPGIGSKVADCIMLFSMGKYESFPVDVWVKRVMEEFYIDENLSLNKIRQFSIEKFGLDSGFAQQYLFYYARELGIGKK